MRALSVLLALSSVLPTSALRRADARRRAVRLSGGGEPPADDAQGDAAYRMRQVKMGVLGVDYQYNTNYGDLLDARSHDFTTSYAVVPGLTFDICKEGRYTKSDREQNRVPFGEDTTDINPGYIPEKVKEHLENATRALLDDGADFITGDCGFQCTKQIIAELLMETSTPIDTPPRWRSGFMLYYQVMIRQFVDKWVNEKPKERKLALVSMSSLNLLPTLLLTTPHDKKICILTAKEDGLKMMRENLQRVTKEQLGDKPSFIDFSGLLDNERVFIKGMDEMSTPFQESLNLSPLQWSQNWADRREIMNKIARKAKEEVDKDPDIHCFVIECTEAYGFAEQIKFMTGRPVYTGNTAAQFLSLGYRSELPANTIVDDTGFDPGASRERPAPVYGKCSRGAVCLELLQTGDKGERLMMDCGTSSSQVKVCKYEEKESGEKSATQTWLYEKNKIKRNSTNQVLTLEYSDPHQLEKAKVVLKEDGGHESQLWLYEGGKIKYAANPDYVLCPKNPKHGATLCLRKDKLTQDPSEKWSMSF